MRHMFSNLQHAGVSFSTPFAISKELQGGLILSLARSQFLNSENEELLYKYFVLKYMHLPTARFLTRCSLFCLLWVATNYMYIHSLKILLATDVMALFATNVSCVYLLSWVILHEQFVGVRVSRCYNYMCNIYVIKNGYLSRI
jgi:hypothetical protein